MSWFAKIDLSNAYFQVMLDKDSRNATTIATPAGLYRYKRLPMGLKSSSSIFQKAMEYVSDGSNNNIIYQGDILIGAPTEQQLDLKMQQAIK